jgi:hypothetical protein
MHRHTPRCLIRQYRLHYRLEREELARASAISLDDLVLFEWEWAYPTAAECTRLAEGFAKLTGASRFKTAQVRDRLLGLVEDALSAA